MKKIFFLALAVAFSSIAFAQNTVTHKIQKGETIEAVAHKYGVHTKDVLQANGLSESTILRIGQIVKIPNAKKKAEEKKKDAEAKVAPKNKPTVVKEPKEIVKKETLKGGDNQHLIKKGETLGRIAKQYNATEKKLMEWNKLANDNIRAGEYIYISNPNVSLATKEVAKKEETKSVVKNEGKKESIKVVNQKVDEEQNKEEIKTKETAKAINTKESDAYEGVQKQLPKIESKKEDVKEVIAALPPTSKNNEEDKGAFEGQYSGSSSSVEGTCGLFKTIAGWHDKKYYILLNNADNGSIVKVVANNKFVYAKVLGPLPDISSEKNYTMRVSNATAAALGITDSNKFNAKVEF